MTRDDGVREVVDLFALLEKSYALHVAFVGGHGDCTIALEGAEPIGTALS